MIRDELSPILEGRTPETTPPRVEDFEELDKRSIDSLIEYMKYVATASGITMGFYANSVRDNVGQIPDRFGKAIVFCPVIFWFLAITLSVIGVFPRTYKAVSDYEKEQAVLAIRHLKSKFARLAVVAFLLGFAMFAYVTAATLWKFYPLH